MTNDALLSNAPPLPTRQPQSAERLWTVFKDDCRYDGELRDHGEWGVEFHVLRESEFLYGRRRPEAALAMSEADQGKVQDSHEGGMLIG